MYGIELIDVGWADEIAIVFVIRRLKVCGDVYMVTLNNVTRDFIGRACTPHDKQDREAIEFFTDLLNDEQAARKAFNIE